MPASDADMLRACARIAARIAERRRDDNDAFTALRELVIMQQAVAIALEDADDFLAEAPTSPGHQRTRSRTPTRVGVQPAGVKQ